MRSDTRLALLILFLIILGCGPVTPGTTPVPATIPPGVTTIPATAPPEPASIGLISREEDTVEQGRSDATLARVVDPVELLNGDVVHVFGGGVGYLDFGANRWLRLFNDSQLNQVVIEPAPDTPFLMRAYLLFGGFTGKLSGANSRMEFRTPNQATITIRGTEFCVVYDPTTRLTTVCNFTGTVEVSTGGQNIPLPSGEYIVVGPGGPVARGALQAPLNTLLQFEQRARQSPLQAADEATRPASVDQPPVAGPIAATTSVNTPVEISVANSVSDPDGAIDFRSLRIATPPDVGTARLLIDRRAIVYAPPRGFAGTVIFRYAICDMQNLCAENEIRVRVEASEPTTKRLDVEARVNQLNIIDLRQVVSDPGDSIDWRTLQFLTEPDPGTLVPSDEPGVLLFRIPSGFIGETGFTYRICNSSGRCADGEVRIVVAGPTVVLDLIEAAANARWRSSAADILEFGGSDGDERGYVRYWFNSLLEDGSQPSRVLTTHPTWVPEGYIIGTYPERITIQQGDALRLRVGFLSGAQAGSVIFQVFFSEPGIDTRNTPLANIERAYTGQMLEQRIDLSDLAGRTGTIEVRVFAGADSSQDWATWEIARIERNE